MSDKNTAARPYAKAAFEFALKQNNLAQWAMFLEAAAFVCVDERIQPLLIDPRVTTSDLYELFRDVCAQWMDDKSDNFLRLLAANKRLNLLPEMTLLFVAYRAEQEKTLDVDVFSFMQLTDEQQQHLSASLQKRLKREIALHCHIDEKILGGVIVRAGDLVIDGSVLGQLQKMHHQVIA